VRLGRCRAGAARGPQTPPPAHLPLPFRTVQVWLLDDAAIEPVCAALAETLSPDERQRACAFRHEHHRRRFIARRAALRRLIGGYLSRDPAAVRFGMLPLGKPVLQGEDAARLAFSVSHTDGMALLAFAWDCRVGVDVEQRIDGLDVSGIGRGILSAREETWLASARHGPAASVLGIWTRKEALLKALGTGLAHEPDAYTTEDDARPGEGRWRASRNGTPIAGWTCMDLFLGPRFLGALAVSVDEAVVTVQAYPLTR
jgi:4'-phosphopantetheinyl transferase